MFKHSETKNMNRYAVTSANYLAACVVSAVVLVAEGFRVPSDFALGQSLGTVFKNLGPGPLDPDTSLAWALLCGLGAGIFFFLGFIYYQVAVRRHGMALAGSFIKLGALVPMTLSLVIWREWPGPFQWLGLLLAAFSLVLASIPTDRTEEGAWRPALLLLCLFGGIAEFSNKVFQKYGLLEHKSLFLLTTFSMAFLCSMVVTYRVNKPVAFRDILVGILVGIPNLFASFFLILALVTVPAAVAYPVFGAGSILIINLAGVIFFGERLSQRERIAVLTTVLALVVINFS